MVKLALFALALLGTLAPPALAAAAAHRSL